MSSIPNFHRYQNTAEFASAIAKEICSAINLSDSRFILGVSGGSTPIPIYQKLNQCRADWRKVCIALVDERFVPPEDPASNETAVKESLLQGAAQDADFIGLWSNSENAECAASVADAKLKNLNASFDFILLGMGLDGHFASIFPGATQLEEALDLQNNTSVMALTPAILPEHAPHPRLTLSLAEISRARRLVLAINGEDKLSILKDAYKDGNAIRNPVAALFNNDIPPLEIHWSP